MSGLSRDELTRLFRTASTEELAVEARAVCERVHGDEVLLRGLVEISNRCGRDCLYCGIRNSASSAVRYRLSPEAILEIVRQGFRRGLRTFVLQGGEDPWFTTDRLCALIDAIKRETNDEAAVTLSLGIKPRSAYRELRAAGADRYLMRFETSDPELHRYLRNGATLERRLRALEDLAAEGFQTGSGFMVGLPGETDETLLGNLLLCRDFEFDMTGIGPFIPHPETPLASASGGSIELTVRMTALLRLALPLTHIPATTAAGSIDPEGREKMIAAGANVLMPNITPPESKRHYLLYPGKICLDESGFSCIGCLALRVKPLDRRLSFARGDAVRLAAAEEVTTADGTPGFASTLRGARA